MVSCCAVVVAPQGLLKIGDEIAQVNGLSMTGKLKSGTFFPFGIALATPHPLVALF